MKCFASAALLLASATANPFAPKVTRNTAKASYIGSLMRGAQPIRKLEDNGNYQVDLSSYSIKFEKCQFVKQYGGGGNGNKNNNNKNNKNGVDNILATKHFVIFRLCPDGSCSSCDSNYGEYIVDMDTYLESTLQYKQEQQETYCQNCNDYCQNQNNGDNADGNANYNYANIDCSTCYDECQNIENMENNGYLDAADYTECQKLYEDGNGNVYYAGPVCASGGTRIKIGVFTDEQCSFYDDSLDVESYLSQENNNNNNNNNGNSGMKLSYHLLKQVFSESDCIASCIKEDENANQNNNNNNNNQNVEINEACQNLYEAAGKCESSHGFTSGINYYNENYENQVLQEELVCEFISSISAGSYDQTGEIVITGGRKSLESSTSTTGGQKFALTFFILGSVGLAGYAAMLHSQLTKGAKADLSRQGGAMA